MALSCLHRSSMLGTFEKLRPLLLFRGIFTFFRSCLLFLHGTTHFSNPSFSISRDPVEMCFSEDLRSNLISHTLSFFQQEGMKYEKEKNVEMLF